MPATVLEGKRIRDQILSELKPRVDKLRRPPGLAVILVGHDPGSEIYVRGKIKATTNLGLARRSPRRNISTGDLLGIVESNQRPEITASRSRCSPPQIDSRWCPSVIRTRTSMVSIH
jgi:methylenetetrahydrofolate dehydrogenase (NADP+)/methenyltetrahydrofolate cyclohydrolase